MPQDLFRVEVGFADDNIYYLSGPGAPTSQLANNAPIGSKWTDTTTGDVYTKTTSGWLKLATGDNTDLIQQEVDNVETSIGLQADGSLNWQITPTNFSSTDTIVSAIKSLDTAVTNAKTAADNAQATADSKVSKSGDTITGNLVMSGGATITGLPLPVNPTDAVNKSYVDSLLNGISWMPPVDSIGSTLPSTAATGERFLNTTDNKIYTATAPDTWDSGYTPEDGDAIFDKSTETGYVFSGTTWVQFTGAGQIDAGVGLSKVGNIININLGAGITETPTDEIGIDYLPDSGLFTTVDGVNESNASNAKLSIKLDGSTLTKSTAGLRVSQTLVDQINSASSDIQRIKAVLGNARSETIARNVTSETEVDYVPTANAAVVKWIVHVTGTGADANKKQVVEILAMHDGAPGQGNATTVDYTSYAKLKLGTLNFSINVAVDAAGSNQKLSLKVTSTSPVDVAAIREIVFVGDTVYTTHGEIVVV